MIPAAPMPTPRSRRLWLLLPLALLLAGAGGGAAYVRAQAAAQQRDALAEALRLRLDAERRDATRRGALGAALADTLAGPGLGDAPLHPATRGLYGDALALHWTEPARRSAALALLADADRLGLAPERFHADALLRGIVPEPSVAHLAAFDAALTSALLRLGDALVGPNVDAHALYGADWYPHRRLGDPTPALAAALDAIAGGAAPRAALDAYAAGLQPQHPEALRLARRLAAEVELADRTDLVLARDLGPGDVSPDVTRLRERLALDGAVPGPASTPEAFDAGLADALRRVQTRDSLAVTGVLDEPTRRALNTRRPDLVPVLARTLERWRWLPDDLGDLHVFVNLPDYEIVLRERQGDALVDAFHSVAAVGKPTWETPVFSDSIETVVFNPTWTIPASIQREQWGTVRGYVVQPPGPRNPMGRVKFVYPNGHAIFIHDTTAKWGFEREDRALSHGCVRVADPRDLAAALLSRTAEGWDAGRVAAVFEGPWGRTQAVPLDRRVPIHHVYLTARVDADGRLTLPPDVYGYDDALDAAMGLGRNG